MKGVRLTEAVCAIVLFLQSITVIALDNGLALLPPLGFATSERFRCNVDCDNDPNNCISEKLFMQMADTMVSQGYRDTGYNYMILGDCWMAKRRLRNGILPADPKRFPRGIKFLAEYMHSRGLKLGIFQSLGNTTCNGYPGISKYLELDARTFAKWKVDYVKIDACNFTSVDELENGYVQMGHFLNRTGRPIVYSCNWPLNLFNINKKPNYDLIGSVCNVWRYYKDIQDSYESVKEIMDFFGDNQDVLRAVGGPGRWNHPDVMILGNFGLSYDQARTQMAVWTILAAPMIISADLRNIERKFEEIYRNKFIVAIDQDVLGMMPLRFSQDDGLEIWLVAITPTIGSYYSYCIGFINRRTNGLPTTITVQLSTLGLNYTGAYQITECFDYLDMGDFRGDDNFTVTINPTGVYLIHARVVEKALAGCNRGWYNPATGQYESDPCPHNEYSSNSKYDSNEPGLYPALYGYGGKSYGDTQ